MNAYILGTSNSVLLGGYISELRKSRDIHLVGSTVLGDVPITNFISVREDIERIQRYTEIDLIIIDTCINDTLMLASGKLTKENIQQGMLGVSTIIKSLTKNTCQVILLNFLPEAVKKVAVFKEIKEFRYLTCKRILSNVVEIDISNDVQTTFFNSRDPLHVDKAHSHLVCKLISDFVSETIFEKRNESTQLNCQYSYLNLRPKGFLSNNGETAVFSTRIHSEVGVFISYNTTYSLRFETAVRPLGIRFVSNNTSDMYMKVSLGDTTFYAAVASRSQQNIVRFLPLPLVDSDVKSVDLGLVKKDEVDNTQNIIELPNSKEAISPEADSFSKVLVLGLVHRSCTVPTIRSTRSKPKMKINFQYFWPGFLPEKDKIFGDFLKENYDVTYVSKPHEADIVVASWCTGNTTGRNEKYLELKRQVTGKLVYYTAEHDGLGLDGEGQLNFEIFDHIFSHYIVNSTAHTWMPNYVRRYGIDVFSEVNRRYLENIEKPKFKNIQFCYGNPNCKFRNDFFHKLNREVPVDANGKLFNKDGIFLPREKDIFLSELSAYKFVIAFENSSSKGYNTEKIVHALMAGTVPLYWGDPFVNIIWNEKTFIQVNKSNQYEVIAKLAENPDKLFTEYTRDGAVPFEQPFEFQRELTNKYINTFNSLITRKR